MKHLKKYNESVPPLEDWYPNKPEKLDEKLKGEVRLYRIGKSVYSLTTKDADLRGLIFCKPQEYYEAFEDKYRNQAFELEDYMEWYKIFYKTDKFDYGEEWQGFNVPSNILDECFPKIKNLTYYDQIMLSVMDTIRQFEDDKYYLVGVDQQGGVLKHEFAHALYFISPEYKAEMEAIISNLSEKESEELHKMLYNMGYGPNVMNDEIQAYVATSPGLSEMCVGSVDFKETFLKYYGTSRIKPRERITINFRKEIFE